MVIKAEDAKERRINCIINEAYSKVPFYEHFLCDKKGDISKQSLKDVPRITKKDMLMSDYVNVNQDAIRKSRDIISIMTSGTMGEPFEIKWSIEDEKRSLLQLWLYRKKYYNIMPNDKLCYFFPGYIEEIDTISDKNFLAFSRRCIYDGTLNKVYKKILLYNPKWMILQPSMAFALCQIAEDMKAIPTNLAYIECTGEELTDAIRNKIEKVFKCKVANQYGCKEVGSIAYECPYGNLHCMDNSVITEIDENTSDIYVTSLDNHIMPFVNYCTGDKGILERSGNCKCKNMSPIIKLSVRRKDEYIYLKDRKLHIYVLIQIIEKINYLLNNCIMQYRITQNDYESFLFELVIEENCYDEQVKAIIHDNVKQHINVDANITVKIYRKYIKNEGEEKHSTFVCNIKGKGS
ncbi:MAG: hypothetical protein ACI4EW_05125 [Butyrivibrio sp.]